MFNRTSYAANDNKHLQNTKEAKKKKKNQEAKDV